MPFNPGNQDRSGEIFAQFLSQGAGDVAKAIDTIAQDNADARASDLFIKNHPEALQAANLTPDQYASLGSRHRTAVAQSAITDIGIKQRINTAKLAQLQVDQQTGDQQLFQNLNGANPPTDPMSGVKALSPAGQRMLSINRFNSLVGGAQHPEDSGAGAVNAQLTGGAPSVPGTGGGVTPEQIIDFARKSGLAPAEVLEMQRGNLADSTGKAKLALAQLELAKAKAAGQTGKPTMDFIEDPVTGSRFGLDGRTALPSGVNPAKAITKPGDLSKAQRLDEQTITAYHNQLLGVGTQDGLLRQIAEAEQQNADAKAGVVKRGQRVQPFPQQHLDVLTGMRDRIQGALKAHDNALASPAAAQSDDSAKVATPEIARQYLQQAGGDKAKARALAKQAGYTF